MVNPSAAVALAVWVRFYHPELFSRLAEAATARSKLGCVSCAGGLGALGQDVTDMTSVMSDAPTLAPDNPLNIPALDVSAIPGAAPSDTAIPLDTIDPSTLSPVTVDAGSTLPEITPPPATSSAADLGPQSTTGSYITSALASVGKFLTTGGGLTSAMNLGSAVLANQASRNVLATQVARVSAGANPAAIGYTVNPTTGQLVPYLQTSSPAVQYPASPSVLAALTPGSTLSTFVSQYGLWLLIGVGVLLVISRR